MTIKEKLHEIAESLSDAATWEDVEQEIITQEKLERADSEILQNKIISKENIIKEFKISK